MVKVTTAVKKAKLDSYTFPEEFRVDEKKEWTIRVSNVGDLTCEINARITNLPGNPGAMIVTFAGKEYTILPGYKFETSATLKPGEYYIATGDVRFKTAGKYKVRISACHEKTEDEKVELDG
jgi:hypothetical protein